MAEQIQSQENSPIKKRGVSTLVGIIIILAVAVISFGGVFVYQYYLVKSQPVAQEQEQIIGGDVDSHGCLGSAGYIWCEAKQKCLRVWKEPCEADLTAGWQTYTNTDYGFEFKYPQDIIANLINHAPPHGTDLILPGNNSIVKEGAVGDILTFVVFQKTTSDLEGYISKDLANSNTLNTQSSLPQSTYSKIDINGTEAYEIKYPNSIYRVYVQNSKNTLFFQYTGDGNTTAKQIVSTFKFTK